MSGEFLARLKAEQPDVDWDARVAEARARQERSRRNPWNRLVHWVHAEKHPELHRERCSACVMRAESAPTKAAP